MRNTLCATVLLTLAGLLTVSGQRLFSNRRSHCYSCSASTISRYGRDFNCVANVSAARTVSCRSGYYCLTQFSFSNGVLSRVRRTCQNPSSDHDSTTNEAPTEDGCVSSYSRYNVQGSVQCYYHCTKDRCNNLTPRTYQRCSEECEGTCDAITGECPVTKRCVQCNDESDEKCEGKTEATSCPQQANNYCATSRTTRFGYDLNVIKTSITKSCATIRNNGLPPKRCQFATNNLYNAQPYITYVCSDFCTEDGCNIAKDTSEQDRDALRCVVCSEKVSTSHCTKKTETTVCPTGSTHCKSTVTYYVTSSRDYTSAAIEHRIASVKRECASEPVKPNCVTKPVEQVGLDVVTCEETCGTSGCNVGWPARPRCSQCNGTNSTAENDACKVSPPTPASCPSPAHAYCFTMAMNTESIPGFSTKVSRGCSITDIGNSCTDERFLDTSLRNCQTSCKIDGCNQGILPNTGP